MRILLISNIFPPGFIGGYELAARDVARMLAARGHAVTVVSSPALEAAPDPPEPFALLRRLHCASYTSEPVAARERVLRGVAVNLGNLEVLGEAIRQVAPELVLHLNLAGLGPLGILRYVAALGLPSVGLLMDDWFRDLGDQAAEVGRFRALLGMQDVFAGMAVIACSARLMLEIDAGLGSGPTPATIVPGWVDPACFTPAPPVAGRTVRFVFASRMAGHKGIDLVLRAAALLRDRGIEDFTIDLYGAGAVGRVMAAVHAARLERWISYRGLASKAAMLARFADYDALLFPSWEREPFGFVVAEAACAGCIPIITGAIGAAEFLLDEQDCLKIRRDPVHLAAAMARLIGMPAADRAAFRGRVRRNARATFGAARWFDRIEQALEAAVRAPPDGAPRAEPGEALLAMTLLTHLWRTAVG